MALTRCLIPTWRFAAYTGGVRSHATLALILAGARVYMFRQETLRQLQNRDSHLALDPVIEFVFLH